MKKQKHKGFIVAIDGPAGAGKSTVSKHLAEALEGKLLDTGAMYRVIAFQGVEENTLTEKDFLKIAKATDFSLHRKNYALLANGKKPGKEIRSQKISKWASLISKYKNVRKILTQKQRKIGEELSRHFPVVVEGRDIGSVVFPSSPFKFFITADDAVRAERRYQQLLKQGVANITLEDILNQNRARDKQDSGRKFAPLKCPKDAIVIDTSSMRIPQVVQFMKNHIEQQVLLDKTR